MLQTIHRWLLITILGTVAGPAGAWTLSGVIRSTETGEPVPGAAVRVVGTLQGAAAGEDGRFALTGLPEREVELLVSAVGYRPAQQTAAPRTGDSVTIELQLTPEAVPLDEVQVEAWAKSQPEPEPELAQHTLRPGELTALPRVLEADLFRALQVLPGVLPTSDYSADLNIWGGSSDQNLILFDGAEIYKPTHFAGLFSVFNMDAVQDVRLIKGGYGARYGGRLSAVVDVAGREGRRERMHGKAGVSLLSSQLLLEGALPKGSWLVAGRRTYLDWATRALERGGVIEYDFPYYFYDLNVKLAREVGRNGRVAPALYLGRDALKLDSDTDDRVRLRWGNAAFSLPWTQHWSRRLFSTTALTVSRYDADFRFESIGTYAGFRNRIGDVALSSDWRWRPGVRHGLEFGCQVKRLETAFFMGATIDTLSDVNFGGWQNALYAADDWSLTDSWTLTPGLRLERSDLTRVTDVLPRLAVTKEFPPHSSISLAWGRYSQYIQLVTLYGEYMSLFDSYVPMDRSLRPPRGEQVALSFEHEFGPGLRLATDVYYKRFQRVIEYRKGVEPGVGDARSRPLAELFNTGQGEAWGWDLLLQGGWGRQTFMIGYGLGRSTRSFDAFDGGRAFPASFDRLHNSNLLLSRRIGQRGTLDVRFVYATGKPITRPAGLYFPAPELIGSSLYPGPRNGHRLPPYHRLDLAYRLRYEFRRWTFAPYVELINVYNRRNVLTEQYLLDAEEVDVDEIYQLPFLPALGFAAEF